MGALTYLKAVIPLPVANPYSTPSFIRGPNGTKLLSLFMLITIVEEENIQIKPTRAEKR